MARRKQDWLVHVHMSHQLGWNLGINPGHDLKLLPRSFHTTTLLFTGLPPLFAPHVPDSASCIPYLCLLILLYTTPVARPHIYPVLAVSPAWNLCN